MYLHKTTYTHTYIYIHQAVTSALPWKPLKPKIPSSHLQDQSCISLQISDLFFMNP